MKLSLIIEARNIVTPLQATSIEGIINELLPVATISKPEVCDAYCKELLAREKQGGTLLGRGVYFPHARSQEGAELCIALGLSPAGINLNTPDDEPVHFVLLIVAPIEKNTAMLKARAAFIKLLLMEDFAKRILEAPTPEEVHRIIERSRISVGDTLTVNDIVNRDVITVNSSMTLRALLDLMFTQSVENLPVVDDGKLVGMVTGQEVLRLAIPKFTDELSSLRFIESRAPFDTILLHRDDTTVADIMETEILKSHTDVSLLQIAHMMASAHKPYVCIVDSADNETFVGLVSRRGLLTKVLVA